MSQETRFKTLRDVPIEEYLSPGNSLCAGCGGVLTVRLFHKVLGENVVLVNAAGCMSLLLVYPYSPLKSSWMYTAFASAPAGAQGIRDALDVLIAKGKIPSSEDLKVLVVTGDGAAYDIGLQSTSGAIQRDLDFYYLVYDNEAYGNTGFQVSSSTPFGSSTTTTPSTSIFPEGNESKKKDLFEIWRAHKPPYIATISSSQPVDMLRKIEKSSASKGPKLFIAYSGCPTGWGYDPQDTVKIEQLAIETGIWPLKEALHGELRHTFIPRILKPVESYLKTQERFKHLFSPVRNDKAIILFQENVNSYWKEVATKENAKITFA
jgi:pyruvate ferredoxin oxidoreductase beta subunit